MVGKAVLTVKVLISKVQSKPPIFLAFKNERSDLLYHRLFNIIRDYSK